MWGRLQFSDYDWQYYTEPQDGAFLAMNGGKSYWPRGRVLGGSSVINTLMYTRGSPFDFDEWAAHGCKGWDYKSVLPYFLKSEDILIEELKFSPYHSQSGPLAVSHNPPSGLTSVFLKAGEDLGYEITDSDGRDLEGFSVVQSTIRNGIRSTTGLEFLGKVKKANLDIGIRSFVTKVEIDEGVATGVNYIRNGRKHYVKAKKEVIISAGAINSPQILMLSGIGPKSHLEEIGIPVKFDLPVGQHLKDHSFLPLPSRTNVTLGLATGTMLSRWNEMLYYLFGLGPFRSSGLDSAAFIHLNKSYRGSTYPDIQFTLAQLLLVFNGFNLKEKHLEMLLDKDNTMPVLTISVALTRPKSFGSIRLRSRDPFDQPVINAGYFTNMDDIQTMIGGIRIWEKLLQTQPMRQIGVDINRLNLLECSEHRFRTDAFWECYIRHACLTVYHPASTCCMGPDDDPSAVVDPELRVRGVKNLRVADASVFHDVTSGNINAPTIMIVEKAADMIKGIDSVAKLRDKISIKG